MADLSSYISSRDSQGLLRSKKSQNRGAHCELVGDFIFLYSNMSRNPEQPHCMSGRNIIQRLLALMDRWRRCSDGLKSFQTRQTIRADIHIFLRSVLRKWITNSWFPVQDNAPAHRSVLVKDFLTKNSLAILENPPLISWLANNLFLPVPSNEISTDGKVLLWCYWYP